MRVLKKPLWISMICVVLVGCADKADESIVEFVKQAKTKKNGTVEPLPVFIQPEQFKFSANALRDPFKPYTLSTATESFHPGTFPDLNRPRELLEQFPLDSLRMVGTLEKEGQIFALLKGSNNTLYRVNVGNHMGQHAGRIEKITDKSIEIKEWVNDGKSGWKEHWVTIHLTQ